MKIDNQKGLIKSLEKTFPLSDQENWDFSGFSYMSKVEKKLKILVCLDINQKVISKSIKENVSIILSHHPFLFAKSFKEAFEIDKSKKDLFNLLKQNNISAYSLHTTFDANIKGTDYFLLLKLNLNNKVIKKYRFNSIVKYNNSFNSLIKILKENLKLNFVISNWEKDLDKIIDNIYFAPGAGDIYEYINHQKKDNCDLIVTSDIKWNEQVILQNLGLKFIIVSHKVEDVFVDGMSVFLSKCIDEKIEILLEYNQDNLKVY